MSEFFAPATLTTPGGTLTFNPSSGDGYYVSNITGLDQAPIRAPIDDKPQTDGGIVHDFFKGPRHITIEGLVVASSASARNTSTDSLVTALDSILRADGTWTWTPSGQSLKTLTVRCDVPVSFPGAFLKRFIFGLVAANPVIA
jgi:hypothetical protein